MSSSALLRGRTNPQGGARAPRPTKDRPVPESLCVSPSQSALLTAPPAEEPRARGFGADLNALVFSHALAT